MNNDERHIARVLFQNRVLRADGQGYEDLLTEVLVKALPGFRPVKPQGSKGDRKNDGYVRDEGRYWQVYAPENPAGKGGVAAAKAVGDFEGLKLYWDDIAPIREYRFAHNDKYKGSYPDLEKALAELKTKHGLEVCEPYLAKDLEDAFLGLKQDDIVAIVGKLPNPRKIESIEYDALGEVITHLLKQETSIADGSELRVPEWDDKIEFNGLSPLVASFLNTAGVQVGLLEEYFRASSGYLRGRIRDKLKAAYVQAVDDFPRVETDAEYPGDRIYFALLSSVAPRAVRSVQDATLVVIAYFFEACDVFEEPLTDANPA